MKAWQGVLLFAFGGVLAVASHAPAAWIAPWVPDPIRLHDITGKLWDGQATVATTHTLCRLGWRLKKVTLDSINVDVQFLPPCEGAAQVVVTREAVSLDGLLLATDVGRISAALPQLQTWGPGGAARLESQHLVVSPTPQGQARLTWQGAQLAKVPVAPLGDYQADLTLDGPRMTGTLHTLSGTLNIEGRFELGERMQVDVLARSNQPQIAHWMRTLGVAQADGRYRLRLP